MYITDRVFIQPSMGKPGNIEIHLTRSISNKPDIFQATRKLCVSFISKKFDFMYD